MKSSIFYVLSDGFGMLSSIGVLILIKIFLKTTDLALYGTLQLFLGIGIGLFRLGIVGNAETLVPSWKTNQKKHKTELFNSDSVSLLLVSSLIYLMILIISKSHIVQIFNIAYITDFSYFAITLLVFFTLNIDHLYNLHRSNLNIQLVANINLLRMFLRLLFITIAVFTQDFTHYILLSLIGEIITWVFFLNYLIPFRNIFSGISLKVIDFSFGISDFFLFLMNQIDLLLFSIFSTPEIFAEYILIKQIFIIGERLLFSLNSSITPYMSAVDNFKLKNEMFHTYSKIYTLFGFLIFSIINFIGINILNLINFPFDNLLSLSYVILLSISILTRPIYFITISGSISSKNHHLIPTYQIIMGFFTLFFTSILLSLLGLVGIILGHIIGNLFGSIIINFHFTNNVFIGSSLKYQFFYLIISSFLASIVILVINYYNIFSFIFGIFSIIIVVFITYSKNKILIKHFFIS